MFMKFLIGTAIAFIVVVPLSVLAQSTAQDRILNYDPYGDVLRASANSTTQSSGGSCTNIKTTGIEGLVGCAITLFNYAIYLIMAFSVLYVVWGASKLMREEGRDEGKRIVLYGITGLFVMVSIWGLVNILDNTFNLSGSDAIKPPSITPR